MTYNHTRHNALRRALPLLLGALFAGPALADKADPVGEVSTAFKLFGPNHKILVEAFDDPRIDGVACYLARPKTGGVKGGLGLVICHSWQGTLLWPALAGFVLLWIAQFVGHRIEGKRPSFLADLQFLLIGPAWVLASLYRRLGIPY